MDKKKVSWLVLALLVVVAAGTSASLMYESSQIEQLAHSVTALSDRIDKLTGQPSANPDGKILAASPDGKFMLRGIGACNGEFTVSQPKEVTEGGASYAMYDLIHPVGPEDSDLGSVAVQTSAQLGVKPLGEPYADAFSKDDYVVKSVLTDIAAEDCKVTVTEK